jgi:hypothetical protein
LNLDDCEVFPMLLSLHSKQAQGESNGQVLTPEKEPQSQRRRVSSEKEKWARILGERASKQAKEELSKDWVVVAPEDGQKANVPSSVATTAFDGQHPRNMFANKSATRNVTPKDDSKEGSCAIDWSSAGMPTALIKRLINGSANSAHRAPRAEKDVTPVPMNVLRAKNLGSSKRERSTPKSPRSSSKPRGMKHGGRC